MPLTMFKNKFSISYYLGDDVADCPKLQQTEFETIAAAGAYVDSLGVGHSRLSVTEWDNSQSDGYGVPECIGSCNLDEAVSAGYTSIDTY